MLVILLVCKGTCQNLQCDISPGTAPQVVESSHSGWENMDNMEKMENISHMTQNTLLMIQNSLPRTRSTQFAIQMTQTTLVHGIYGDGQKSHNMRLENMILVQLKIEERQTTCGGLSPG